MSLNVDGASRALASVVKEASSMHIEVLLLQEVNIGKVVTAAIDERVQQCGMEVSAAQWRGVEQAVEE